MSGHRELTPGGATIQAGKACADEPFPVVGRDVRSGGGDRRAGSSRGDDNDALTTDLHNHHRTHDVAELYNHLRLVDDGEVQVRGPDVMGGYWKRRQTVTNDL